MYELMVKLMIFCANSGQRNTALCFQYMKYGRCQLLENAIDKDGSNNCFFSHKVELQSCYVWICSLSSNNCFEKLKKLLDCISIKSSPFNKYLNTDWGKDVVAEIFCALVRVTLVIIKFKFL